MSFWDKLKELKAILNKYREQLRESDKADAYTALDNKIGEVAETANRISNEATSESAASTQAALTGSVGNGGVNKKEDVRTVQALLNKKGESLVVDGAIGGKTIAAIERFQRTLGTSNPDGRVDVGGRTWKALSAGTSDTGSTTPVDDKEPKADEPTTAQALSGSVGNSGVNKKEDVRTVQALLNKKGEKLVVDGAIGANTIAAIERFQRTLGTKNPDGRIDVGGRTWKALSGGTSSTDDNTPGDDDSSSGGSSTLPQEVEPALAPTSKITASVGAGGKNKAEDVLRVKQLLNKFGHKLEENGVADTALTNAIKDFQQKYRGATNPDGRVDAGGRTWGTLLGIGRIQGNLLTIAKEYSVEPAVILAIQQIESGGNGFYSDGRPKILFEGHVFWRQLERAKKQPADYLPENDDILYKSFDRSKYEGGLKEYDRLERAKKIDKIAALKSASWGEFQIMGFNHATVGYSDVESFVAAMYIPNGGSLKAVMEFLKNKNLIRHVQGSSKDWAALAKGYNGSLYWKNKYDEKLEAAYNRFSKL